MAKRQVNVGGSVNNSNIIVGDKNLIMQVSGDLIFNAAEYSQRRQRRDLRKMLRVLVILSAPVLDPRQPEADLTPLDLQAEWNRLAEAVQASGAPIALIRLMPPTLDALRYALSPRAVEQGLYPHVLHFSGHAWSEGLLFEDEYSQCDAVTTARLLEALKDAPPLDLAVFNACQSAEGALSAAQAFAQAGRARAALGHPQPVLDDDAVQFAARLYAEMARGGYTLKEAFDRAQASVRTHVPRLFGRDDLRLEAVEPGEPLTDARRTPGNLPARERFFFGRGRELVTLAHILEKTPSAAIISGVSGMGKTALALEAAHRNAWRFPGGVVFGDGRGAPLADLLLSDMALGLELPLQSGQKPEETLLAYARQNPTLFLLDNLEDLPEADLKRLAAFLRRLAPSSASIATLRPPAPLFEELPTARPLPLHEGLGAQAARRYLLALGEQKDIPTLLAPHAAAQLAKAGRGHPLVLEKLAALAARRPAESILRAARELKGDYLAILRTVMDWSLAALDEGARQALACLPVFGAGSCTPEAWAAALDVSVDDLFPRADALREAALLTYTPLTHAPQFGRYRWHASVSDYARAALPPAAPDEARRRAVEQICAVFDNLPASADPSTRPDLMEDLLNLYLLEDWALAQPSGDILARMATAPRNWWVILSFHKNWLPWLQAALQKGITAKGLRANVLQAIGDVQNFRKEIDAALESYGEALKLFRQVGDRLGEANVLKAIGDVHRDLSELPEARARYEEALPIYRAIGDKLGEANTLSALLRLDYAASKNVARAEQKLAQVISLRRAIGDRYGEGADLGNFAISLLNTDQKKKAREYALRARQIFEQIQIPPIVEMMNRVIEACEE